MIGAACLVALLGAWGSTENLVELEPSRVRLDARYEMVFRSANQVDGALPVHLDGFTPSGVGLSGEYFFKSSPWGLGLDAAYERFLADGTDLLGAPLTLPLVGWRGSGSARWRWTGPSGFSGQLELGYGATQAPAIGTTAGVAFTPVRGNGPIVAASVSERWSDALTAQLFARSLPYALSGSFGGESVHLSDVALGAQLLLGRFMLGGIQWMGLVAYELSFTSSSGDAFSYSQLLHRIEIGVRAATPPVRVDELPVVQEHREPPPAPPPPRVEPPKPTGPGTIHGVARLKSAKAGATGAPLAGITVEVAGTAEVVTAEDGVFALPGVGPGPVRVAARAEGFRPAEEIVDVPPGGEARLELSLQRVGVRTLATVQGQVRSITGEPLRATIRIPEAHVAARAGKDGRFQVRVLGGRYTIFFEAGGFEGQGKTLDVADGDQAFFDIQLTPEAR